MGLKVTPGMTVLFDTSPLIYYFERHDRFFAPIASVIDAIHSQNAGMLVSMVSYIEIATLPARKGDTALVGKYRELLTQSEHVGVRGVDLAIADAAVHLRARHALRTSDAIILATGLVCGADCVVTNDAAWKRVDELRVVLIDDLITTGE